MSIDISHNTMVHVNIDRIQKLESLEQSLSSIIVKAIADYKTTKLKELHERDKNNPEGVKIRVRRYLEKHKDEVNKRRREKRKELKQNITINSPSSILDTIKNSFVSNIQSVSTISLSNDITISFD